VSSFPILHSLDPSSLILGGDRGTNILDGGAPFYNVYTCKDGRWMSVGCLEPAFFKVFIEKFLEALPKAFALQDGWMPTDNVQMDTGEWPKLKELLEKGFMTNTRDYWEGVFHGKFVLGSHLFYSNWTVWVFILGTDACAVPVLTPTEAAALDLSPSKFPAPHPKVAGTGNSVNLGLTSLNLRPGQHTEEVLHELGLSNGERNRLALDGALGEDAQSVAWRKPKL
jgi:alpha-methylacyl-CoA racemase